MAEAQSRRYTFFKLLLVVGALLGILLLVQSARTYQFISKQLIVTELHRETGRQLSYFMQLAHEKDVERTRDFSAVTSALLNERGDEIAWIRLLNARAEVIHTAGYPEAPPCTEEDTRELLSGERVMKTLQTSVGPVLVSLRPLRLRFTRARPGSAISTPAPPPDAARFPPPPSEPGMDGELRDQRRAWGGPILVEMALYWSSVAPEFGGLRRVMFIQVSAAIALLAAMAIIALRFGNYLHGKQLEQQLDVARNVQQDLLPQEFPSRENLDVSAICDPAWQVGGDFYDAFQLSGDRVALVLGDVSGKGLPAALLMGLIHGAVRSGITDGTQLEDATRRLNELLCDGTAVERFVTMFWCSYAPSQNRLRYVNAGHLAPFVVRRDADGGSELLRLEEGGPVLGVVRPAPYRAGEVDLRMGDLLVLFSDGVIEAANEQEEEYGEERLASILREIDGQSATDVRDTILADVRQFAGGQTQRDDLTLLVVRACGVTKPQEELETAELLTA